jgi:hypothetical protein
LSRNIRKYEYVKRTNEVMINETLSRSTGKEVIAIDISDIIKEYGKKMENLYKVYDGSKKEIGNGYEMLLSSSIIGGKITPIYLETYSSKGKDYDRRWYKIKKLLNMINKQKKSGRAIGTLVMDRGFDATEYYKYMINSDLDFIVRLKLNRNIEAFKRNIKVEDVFDIISTREHLSEVLHEKKKKKTKIKIGYTEIKIEGIDRKLTLVVIKSKYYSEPMYLITNKKCSCSQSAKLIYEKYLQRWGIETLIRALKEEYNIEDVRILKYQGIKNIISLAFFCLFIVSKIVYSIGHNTEFIKRYLIKKGKRIKKDGLFLYHAVSNGISSLLLAYKKKIVFYPIFRCTQYVLFNSKFFG